ncbi:MAG: hypothetical protein ABI592_10160 [Acidobacteriota bacterium]
MTAVRIRIEVEARGSAIAPGSLALAEDPLAPVELRFRIRAAPDGLEALLHARRSMIREERTLGLREGEPSLEDAVFSTEGILWPARPDQTTLCLEKIALLEGRVERTLAETAGA